MLSTLFLALEYAIYIGVIMSMIFYLRRTSRPSITILPAQLGNGKSMNDLADKVQIIQIEGSLHFGTVTKIESYILALYKEDIPNLLIVCDRVALVDLAGVELLEQLQSKWNTDDRGFYLCSLKYSVQKYLTKTGYIENLGEENLFDSKMTALRDIKG
jgi:SulP family sulfate permease